MKLITELNEEVQVIEENVEGKKTLFIEGIFLQGDIVNRNKRMYPFDILRNEVSRYIRESVNTKRAFGELSHPDSPGINLDRVSHIITSLKESGKNYVGKARILDTPNGKIVQGILSGGGRLGVSSRGMGSIEMKEGVNYVKEDFRLATAADIVADPSAPDAFVNGIMEGVEWIYESGVWKQKDLDAAKEKISKAAQRKLCEQKMKVFNEMLRKANML